MPVYECLVRFYLKYHSHIWIQHYSMVIKLLGGVPQRGTKLDDGMENLSIECLMFHVLVNFRALNIVVQSNVWHKTAKRHEA